MFLIDIGLVLDIRIETKVDTYILSAYKSNIYSNLNEGKAIAISIKAGVIVQINSINVGPNYS